MFVIGVGAQSTLGARHFARKYMDEKLAKCSKFTLCLSEKIVSPIFLGGGANRKGKGEWGERKGRIGKERGVDASWLLADGRP